jgi:thymidylate synthase
MSEGFPLLTTKKMAWRSIVTELLWFLRGDTNIKYLVDNRCHIWDGDAYKNYCNQIPEYSKQFTMSKDEYINKIKTDDEFAEKWGELGPIYGKQWRSWGKLGYLRMSDKDGNSYYQETKQIDQIANLISELKTNPDSRRLMVNAWNVGELDQMILPPCHYGFQVYTRELSESELWDYIHKNKIEILHQHAVLYGHEVGSEYRKSFIPTLKENYNIPTRAISLMWNQRSVDTFLGLPFNIASYGLLLEIIAKAVNMIPDQLIGNLGDVHLYSNHIEQAKEQCSREGFELPTLMFNPIFLANLEHKGLDEAINGTVNFQLENYQSHPAIKAPLSN